MHSARGYCKYEIGSGKQIKRYQPIGNDRHKMTSQPPLTTIHGQCNCGGAPLWRREYEEQLNVSQYHWGQLSFALFLLRS